MGKSSPEIKKNWLQRKADELAESAADAWLANNSYVPQEEEFVLTPHQVGIIMDRAAEYKRKNVA